jgi:hypothetical protein
MSFTEDELQAFNTILEQRLAAHRREVEQAFDERINALRRDLNQRLALQTTGERAAHASGDEHIPPPHIEAIEVQTDLPWEDLADVFGKLLDVRFSVLSESIQAIMRSLEQHLSIQLRNLRGQIQPYKGDLASATNTNDILRGIEHLERIVESMQVVMTTNHALLSNRLYHHQQLPLERAHPSSHTHPTALNGVSNPLSLPGEHDDY